MYCVSLRLASDLLCFLACSLILITFCPVLTENYPNDYDVCVKLDLSVIRCILQSRAFLNKFLLGVQMTKRDPISGEC